MDYFSILDLKREPFSNSPDPAFFYQSAQHTACLQQLELAIRLRRGLNVVIGHVGDSRTYRYRNNELVQLTTDHSLVQEQADLGLISREQARTHSLKNLILRVVGGGTELEG